MGIPPSERSPPGAAGPAGSQQFILVPRQRDRGGGMRARFPGGANDLLRRFEGARSTASPLPVALLDLIAAVSPLRGIAARDLPARVGDSVVQVIDSVHEDGPKLVSLDSQAAAALPALQTALDLRPLVTYQPCAAPRMIPAAAPGGGTVRLRVVDAVTAAGLGGAKITVFTDFARAIGAGGTTDALGRVDLPLGPGHCIAERVFVLPDPAGRHWGLHAQGLPLNTGDDVPVEPVLPGVADGLAHYHRRSAGPGDGAGVRVAVLDCGVGPHPDLAPVSALNTVTGEPRLDGADNGSGHGTHVAGIIAARGAVPGLAPDAELLSWRVFGAGNAPATNYSIMKALIYAVDEGCHIVNLSLGIDPAMAQIDITLAEAIEDASERGAVVVAAAGNDWSEPVRFPARLDKAVAVTAVGRRGTLPGSAYHAWEMASPSGSDPDDVFAAFCNVGNAFNSEVDLIGAGVGILSCVPHGGHAPRSGTSMACAAVSGMAARLLSLPANRHVRDMAPDAARSAAIRSLLGASARSLGLGFPLEGAGLPR